MTGRAGGATPAVDPLTPSTSIRTGAEVAAGDSMAVAAWTAVSRVTGLLRVAVIGAVLGPTFLGNTFQFTNSLPNIVFYGFLAGAMFSSLLVPALVRYVDLDDRLSSERVAGGFLGVTWAAVAVATPIAVLACPWFLHLAAGVDGPAAAEQERVARLLIVMFAPQVFCYALVGTSAAVMNSRRRFTLAAAAPAMENVGILAVLGVAALVHRDTGSSYGVPPEELLILGLGTTTAVALHAAVQWWGARRTGVTLRPRAGWRDPDVRVLVRRATSSLAQTGLNGVQLLATLVVANRLAGGVVAYQVALNFYFLPIAVAATPVALAMLPHLSRMHLHDEPELLRDTVTRAHALALFLAVPAAVGYLVLAGPLAEAVSFGRLETGGGSRLIEVALRAVALGVVGQTVFMVASNASYARKDPRAPLRAMRLQATVCVGLTGVAMTLHGTWVLLAIGGAWSAGNLAGALHLQRHLARDLPPGRLRLAPRLVRIVGASLVMAGVAWLVRFQLFGNVESHLGAIAGLLVSALAGGLAYLATQAALRSPELAWLRHGLGRHPRAAVEGG